MNDLIRLLLMELVSQLRVYANEFHYANARSIRSMHTVSELKDCPVNLCKRTASLLQRAEELTQVQEKI